jgi:glycosyltransferase involved in cell wall biosynthesis
LDNLKRLKVLAFSPYHGGSHAQFLDEWAARSCHEFTCVTLPPRHFKWRMRQASVGMARAAEDLLANGSHFDVIWTTSMLDAAELLGLLPRALRGLPLVVYFHENQLAYPVRKEEERDQHFSFTNWVSALAADEVWFNSAFNRDSMLSGLRQLLKRMPDENSPESVETISRRSFIEPLGVVAVGRGTKSAGPLHIAWVGRWEHDKRAERFFWALRQLQEHQLPFRLTVLGQNFRVTPPEFDRAREEFRAQIQHFGFIEARSAYEECLRACDVVVSTADHEFFGVALLEAVAAGNVPLVPDRLVYPEIYPAECRYSDNATLFERLAACANRKSREGSLETLFDELGLASIFERFDFQRRAPELDEALTRAWLGQNERGLAQ